MLNKSLTQVVAVLILTATGSAFAQPVVGPELLRNVELKQSLRNKSAAEQAAAMEKHSINPDLIDAEAVAIYVSSPLSRQEIRNLNAQGIQIDERQYVPPLAGRHPNGFYLGIINHQSLPQAVKDERFVRLASTEAVAMPTDDLSRTYLNVDAVHGGTAGLDHPFTGAGVKVAVADSGFDTDHPDMPTPVEAFNVASGTSPENWSTVLKHSGDRHGTHVAGTVVGTGAASEGLYRGIAPGADFYAYRISNTITGTAHTHDMIKAINRASEVGVQVFNLSYGSFDYYPDGSSAICQAIDVATENGMLTVVAAGNFQTSKRHVWGWLDPGDSKSFTYTVGNGNSAYYGSDNFQLSWMAGTGEAEDEYPFSISVSPLGAGEFFFTGDAPSYAGVTPRGQKTRLGLLVPAIPAGSGNRSYTVTVTYNSTSGDYMPFHIYATSTANTFGFDEAEEPDHSYYTVTSPAIADTALAVGAWTHRNQWTRFDGVVRSNSQIVDTIATFSSYGPRIDGLLKPEIIAPGTMTISLHTSSTAGATNNIVGPGNTQETARYYALGGTSMAAPHITGLAALMFEAVPNADVEQVRAALLNSGSNKDYPDPYMGYGLPDAAAAIAELETMIPSSVADWQSMH